MIIAGPASFVSSNYHAVFAAKNGTKTTSFVVLLALTVRMR
jgi:hypothetical protein